MSRTLFIYLYQYFFQNTEEPVTKQAPAFGKRKAVVDQVQNEFQPAYDRHLPTENLTKPFPNGARPKANAFNYSTGNQNGSNYPQTNGNSYQRNMQPENLQRQLRENDAVRFFLLVDLIDHF